MPKKKPRLDPERPRLARAYGRVSKVGERGKGGRDLWSPAVQIESGEAYFARLGIPFDKPGSERCGDWDESAFDRPWKDRPGIMQHYQDAKAGRITDLSFYLLSRLGRDLAESLDLIAAFEDAGCLLHFPNEGITPNTGGGLDSGAKLLRNIRLALAETESEDKRLWARAAARKRVEQTHRPMGIVPQWIERTTTQGVPGFALREPQASAMREMVRLRIAGNSYAAIARAINAAGYRTISGSLFLPSYCRRYLTGSYIDTLRGSIFYNRQLPEGDPDRVEIPDCYPHLITEEEAAYLRLMEEKTARTGSRRATSTSYLLTGRVRCPHCGFALHARDGGRGNRCYYCDHCAVDPAGGSRSISAEAVDEATARSLEAVVSGNWPRPPLVRATAAPSAKDALEKLVARRRRLLKLHLEERVSEEDYNAEREEIAKQIAAIEETRNQQDRETVLTLSKSLPIIGVSTSQYLRSLALLLLESVTAPVAADIPEYAGRMDSKRKRAAATQHRRCAHLKLSAPLFEGGPREIFAPLYGNRWKGPRGVYYRNTAGEWVNISPGKPA